MPAKPAHLQPSLMRRVRRVIAYVRWSLRPASTTASAGESRNTKTKGASLPMCYHVE